MLEQLLSFVDRWVPKDYLEDDELLRKSRLVVEACMLVVVLTISYIVFYALVSYPVGAAICAYGLAVGLYVMYDFRSRGNFNYSANFFCGNAIIFFGLLTMSTYGLRTLVAAWMLMIPLSAFLIAGVRAGILWASATLGLIFLLFIFEWYGIGFESYFKPENFIFLNPISLIGLLLYLSLNSLNSEIGKERVRMNLVRAREEIQRKNEEITRINRGLEAVVAQRTEKLRMANEELDTFLYESSHALRRPLMRIVGLMGLIKEEQKVIDPDSLLMLVDMTVESMDTMLRSLILVSEIQNKEDDLAEVDLLAEVAEIAQEHDPEGGMVSLPQGEWGTWKCDRFLFRSLMAKLIENAVFFRKEEGDSHRVQLKMWRENGMVQIQLRDNGMGIDPVVMPSIFKMFVRGTEKSKGSGLGLYIAKKVVDRMGGSIKVDSELGSYTQVQVALPTAG